MSKPERILLHACCAPCSGAIVEALVKDGADFAIFYSNDNIFPKSEYDHRLAEVIRYARTMGVEIIEDDYDHGAWRCTIEGLENEPERGRRCECCFRHRLDHAARYAHEHGFNVLATTLASSRWKDLNQVDRAGEAACAPYDDVRWWARNWRKGGLQERRNEIIREQNFYNQSYCGCEMSKEAADQRAAEKAVEGSVERPLPRKSNPEPR